MILSTAALCLALNIYHEARGESLAGQAAVAHVTMNRVRYSGLSICQVVYQDQQFSWTNNRFLANGKLDPNWTKQYLIPKEEGAWSTAQAVAEGVLAGVIRNNIGTMVRFYHADYVNPVWNKEKLYVVSIGRHLYYRNMTGEERNNESLYKTNWRRVYAALVSDRGNFRRDAARTARAWLDAKAKQLRLAKDERARRKAGTVVASAQSRKGKAG